MSKKTVSILILSGLLIELLYILYRFIPAGPADSVLKYMLINTGVFAILIIAFNLLEDRKFSHPFIHILLLFSFLFGLTLVTSLPQQSDDIYRYLWDGKLQSHGINPYTYAPAHPALERFHSEQLPALVNFPHIKTIYPPVAQLFFRLSYFLFGESPAGMKLLFLIVFLGTIGFFNLLLKDGGIDPRWILLFAWNPLVIMETVINGHLDILMAFFVLATLWYFRQNKPVIAGIALACAILTKIVPVVLVPVFFFSILSSGASLSTGIKKISLFFIPLLLTLISFYSLYWQSAINMFHTALNYSTTWYFNNPLFLLILSITQDNRTAHIIAFSIFIILFIVIMFSPNNWERKVFYTITGFVICNPTIHPWYLILPLALLCIKRSRVIASWSWLIILSYIIVYRYKVTGVWQDSWIIMAMEYLPLLFILILPHFRLQFKKEG